MKSFLKKFRSAFEIPFDPADEKSNRGAIVSGLLNVGIAVAGAYLIPFTLARGFSSLQVQIMWGTFFIFITLRLALGKGYVNTVSLILLFSFWIVLGYEFLMLENGLRAPAYTAAMAFLLAYAGLLHGRRTAWAVAGVTLLINLLVLLAACRRGRPAMINF